LSCDPKDIKDQEKKTLRSKYIRPLLQD